MTDESTREPGGFGAPVGSEPTLLRTTDWPAVVLLLAALAGVSIAHGVAVWTSEPSTQIVLWAGMLVLASLAALSVATSKLVSSAQSRARHVFCSRRLLVLGGCLLLVASIMAGAIVRLDPFHRLAAHGQITDESVVGAGFAGGVMVCLLGAGIAFASAWDARRDERDWGKSLGVYPS